MGTPYDLGWGDPRRGGFDVVSFDIGEGVHLAVRNDDVGTVFAELVRRLMAAGWDGPADAVWDDWGYNPRLKRWAEAAGYQKATAPLSAWSDHSWATAIDLDTAVYPMQDRRPVDWQKVLRLKPHGLPVESGAIAAALGVEWGGGWTEPWDPQHFQIAMTPAKTAEMAARIRAGEDDFDMRTDDDIVALVRKGVGLELTTVGDPSRTAVMDLAGRGAVSATSSIRAALAAVRADQGVSGGRETDTLAKLDEALALLGPDDAPAPAGK